MKRTSIVLSAVAVAVLVWMPAGAEERGVHESHGENRGGHREAPSPSHFRAHPPGQHPNGPTVHPHPVRSLAPTRVTRGHSQWKHWDHPEFQRPVYYWNWSLVHGASCVAEDSYGDQYPVTEVAGPGFGPDAMTALEDAALDRCYDGSGQDPSCYLASCSHY